MASPQIAEGDNVTHSQGRGVVRFLGSTDFAPGVWVGIELALPKGKNDGSVQGKRYFACKPMHGIFAKPESVQKVAPTAPKRPSLAPTASPAPRTAPRPSLAPTSKRLSLAPQPSRPAVKPVVAPSATRPQSMVAPLKPAKPTSRPSSIHQPSTTAKHASLSPRTLSPAGSTGSPITPSIDEKIAFAPSARGTQSPRRTLSTTTSAPQRSTSTTSATGMKAGPARKSLSTASGTPQRAAANAAEITQKQIENERLHGVVEKLQKKMQSVLKDAATLRADNETFRTENERLEVIQSQHDVELEHAILDRESAEVQLDTVQTELDALKEKVAELTEEIEILKMENEEYESGVSPEDRASQSWLHMQRENDRLREALIRLRDISKDTEANLREQLQNLEEDSEQLQTVGNELDTAREEIAEKTDRIQGLEEQLEAALESEELVVSLTQKNEDLVGKVEESNATIEQLEALAELHEDLEASHNATEAQLQELIDERDRQLNTLKSHIVKQDEEIANQSFFITRLHQANEALSIQGKETQASKQSLDEAAERDDQRLKLNEQLKIQNYMDSIKANRIELGLLRLKARQATQHLEIFRHYMPELPSSHTSVLGYLQFERLAAKSNLLRAEMDTRSKTTATFSAYAKLSDLWSLCGQFVTYGKHCSPQEFEQTFDDTKSLIRGIEESLDLWLDTLSKSKDLDLHHTAQDLTAHVDTIKRLQSRIDVSSKVVAADGMVMTASRILSQLDCSARILTSIQDHMTIAADKKSEQEEASSLDAESPRAQAKSAEVDVFRQATESSIAQAKTAETLARKSEKALRDFKKNELMIRGGSSELDRCLGAAEEALRFALGAHAALEHLLPSEDSSEPLNIQDVTRLISEVTHSTFSIQETAPLGVLQQHLVSLIESLRAVFDHVADMDNTEDYEAPAAPWIKEAQDARRRSQQSTNAERDLENMKQVLHEQKTHLHLQSRELDEANLKIEHLESRAATNATRLAELEKFRGVEEAMRESESRAQNAISALKKKVRELDAEKTELERKHAAQATTAVAIVSDGQKEVYGPRMRGLEQEVKSAQARSAYYWDLLHREQREASGLQNSWIGESVQVDTRPDSAIGFEIDEEFTLSEDDFVV